MPRSIDDFKRQVAELISQRAPMHGPSIDVLSMGLQDLPGQMDLPYPFAPPDYKLPARPSPATITSALVGGASEGGTNLGIPTEDLVRIFEQAGEKVPTETVDVERVDPQGGRVRKRQTLTRPDRGALLARMKKALQTSVSEQTETDRKLVQGLYGGPSRPLPKGTILRHGIAATVEEAEGRPQPPRYPQRRAGETFEAWKKRELEWIRKQGEWNRAQESFREMETKLARGSGILSSEAALSEATPVPNPRRLLRIETPNAVFGVEVGPDDRIINAAPYAKAKPGDSLDSVLKRFKGATVSPAGASGFSTVSVRERLPPLLPPEIRGSLESRAEPFKRAKDESKLTAQERAQSFEQRIRATELPIRTKDIETQSGVARRDLPPATDRPAGGPTGREAQLRYYGARRTRLNPSGQRIAVGKARRMFEGRAAGGARGTWAQAIPLLPNQGPLTGEQMTLNPLYQEAARGGPVSGVTRPQGLPSGDMPFHPTLTPGVERITPEGDARETQRLQPLNREIERAYPTRKIRTPDAPPNPGNIQTPIRTLPPGGNVASGSKGLLGALTNPTELARRKGNVQEAYPVQFRGTTYADAETAYKTLQQGRGPTEHNRQLMREIIQAKLEQHPRLKAEIDKRGGVAWLESLSHEVTARGGPWEGKGRESAFIATLIDAYEATGPNPAASPTGTGGYRGVTRIISGGQTGADLAGLLAAEDLGIPTGGAVPKGFRTEAGDQPILGSRFGLTEHASREWVPRTIQNIRDADATIIFVEDPDNITGGSLRTLNEARAAGKPRIVNPSRAKLREFLIKHQVRHLNIAGSRRSKARPGFEKRVRQHLVASLKEPLVPPGTEIETRVQGGLALPEASRRLPPKTARRVTVDRRKLMKLLRKRGPGAAGVLLMGLGMLPLLVGDE